MNEAVDKENRYGIRMEGGDGMGFKEWKWY